MNAALVVDRWRGGMGRARVLSQALATLDPVVEYTPAQTDAADRGGNFCLVGGAGTGKTTVLLHRYLERVRDQSTARVLVLCRNRAAAARFRRAAVRELAGGFDALAITTVWGLALDVMLRHTDGAALALLTSSERRRILDRLLQAESGDEERWPTLHRFVGSPGFLEAVDQGLQQLAAAPTGATPAIDSRQTELAAFAERFAARCEQLGAIDPSVVVRRAAVLLGDGAIGVEEAGRYAEVLIDDGETLTPAGAEVVGALAVRTPTVIAANPSGWVPQLDGAGPLEQPFLSSWPTVVLEETFRRPGVGELIECRHPSVEPDAIAGELLRAHEGGVTWPDMAVIASPRSIPAIARAMARHDIPATVAVRHRIGSDPLTRGIVDLLAWARGDSTALPRLLSSPLAGLDAADARRVQRLARTEDTRLDAVPELAALVDARHAVAPLLEAGDLLGACHEAFRRSAAGLVRLPGQATTAVEERSLDAGVAFLDGLEQFLGRGSRHGQPGDDATHDLTSYLDSISQSDIESEAWWGGDDEHTGGESDDIPEAGVVLTTVAGAAGREWQLVVVAGCVEGTFPRVRRSAGFFEPDEATGDRLRRLLERERRRFGAASSRAAGTLLATAAPEPGVLVSRFVDDWPRRAATLPLDAPAVPVRVAESAGTAPVWPSGSLRLSASQLDTYEDCPLKYAFRYAAGVRTEAGLHADLGTVVHDALADFLDPVNEVPCTREALFETADACWRDDIAPYRPQVEEARRDYYAMLDAWWEGEGQEIAAGTIEVLATERPFEVEVGPHRITGRIDRVDRAADGSGIRVLDYKTGKRPPRPDDVAANIQLATYHLAARRDEEVRGWGEPTELRLLYLRSMKVYDQEVADDHEATTEARILDAAARILAEEFEPSVHADCEHCEFHRLCPLWPEGLEVGER